MLSIGEVGISATGNLQGSRNLRCGRKRGDGVGKRKKRDEQQEQLGQRERFASYVDDMILCR